MDTIADMLIRIKNAQAVKKNSVVVPYSRLNMSILEKLVDKGFLRAAEKKGRKNKKIIELELAYDEKGNPVITDIARVSKLSKRTYESFRKLQATRHKRSGVRILSTTKGILTDEEAIRQKVGGEVLFVVR